MGYKGLEDNCHECGKFLERGWGHMTYHDSRFCSDVCRTKYHNAKKKLKAQKEKMLEFIGFLHEQMKKGGDLSVDAGMVNDMIFDLSRQKSGVKIACKQCGQMRLSKPRPGDKCSFCGDSNWAFGEEISHEQA